MSVLAIQQGISKKRGGDKKVEWFTILLTGYVYIVYKNMNKLYPQNTLLQMHKYRKFKRKEKQTLLHSKFATELTEV